ncbi:MbcA/ParS/Xre antitoxin family protein [Dyadobacter alkalitolerans]|uniref:MbcA/ParS/Xre antitoxin family protein n=1 Tax=Dyadobacter alkalitolerans TaxID=492736 RepID=UPI0003F92711|nr:MbcA/ParS/Xre antitoxin family protein [Dyadobacter alkalitolerans]
MKATEKMNVAKQAISRAELESIYSYGYEVFEDVDRFNRWIFSPNRALGGKAHAFRILEINDFVYDLRIKL